MDSLSLLSRIILNKIEFSKLLFDVDDVGDAVGVHDDQGQVVLPSAGDRDLRSFLPAQTTGK